MAAPIKIFEPGDPIEMRVVALNRSGAERKWVNRWFIITAVYPSFIMCVDKRGRKRTFNYGELVQNGYFERITA